MKVRPKRLVPEAGCCCDWPRRRERLRVERGVAADPEDGAVRLAGVEAAEVAASAAAKAARPAETAPRSRRQTRRKFLRRTVLSTRQGSLRAEGLDRIADAVHVEASQRTDRSRLTADGHRIAAEVGVAGNRGQRRARAAKLAGPAWLSVSARQRARQAQVLRAARGQLADGLRCQRAWLLSLCLLSRARGQHQVKVDRLIAAGRIEHRLLRARREGRELGANHVAPVLRNGHRPGPGDVRGGLKALACKRVLGSHGHAGQRDVAALDLAMKSTAGHRWRGCALRGLLTGCRRAQGRGELGLRRGWLLRQGGQSASHKNPRRNCPQDRYSPHLPALASRALTD